MKCSISLAHSRTLSMYLSIVCSSLFVLAVAVALALPIPPPPYSRACVRFVMCDHSFIFGLLYIGKLSFHQHFLSFRLFGLFFPVFISSLDKSKFSLVFRLSETTNAAAAATATSIMFLRDSNILSLTSCFFFLLSLFIRLCVFFTHLPISVHCLFV